MSIRDRASMGGKARAAKLTPEQRSESARHAVRARWGKNHALKGWQGGTIGTVSHVPTFSFNYIG